VATLLLEKQSAGNYKIEWDASGFCSSIYLYQVHAGHHVETRKMILLQ